VGWEENWTWSKWDKSRQVECDRRHLVAKFHPEWSTGTAGVRATRVLNHATHYWELMVSQRIFGTSMMFGVATRKAKLHSNSFVNLLGEDSNSWGLSHKGLLFHAGNTLIKVKDYLGLLSQI
jgi:SPRY domain-containing SOCS box protein 3